MKLKYGYWEHIFDKDFDMKDYLIQEDSDHEKIRKLFPDTPIHLDLSAVYCFLRHQRESRGRGSKKEYQYWKEKVNSEFPELIAVLDKRIEKEIEKYERFESSLFFQIKKFFVNNYYFQGVHNEN